MGQWRGRRGSGRRRRGQAGILGEWATRVCDGAAIQRFHGVQQREEEDRVPKRWSAARELAGAGQGLPATEEAQMVSLGDGWVEAQVQ
jgi:hypothetical protein